jgi:hypothetical protein
VVKKILCTTMKLTQSPNPKAGRSLFADCFKFRFGELWGKYPKGLFHKLFWTALNGYEYKED